MRGALVNLAHIRAATELRMAADLIAQASSRLDRAAALSLLAGEEMAELNGLEHVSAAMADLIRSVADVVGEGD